MDIKLVKGSTPLFAESLTKTNMANYYQARGIVWDHSQYLRCWEEFDNYEVHIESTCIGIVRFSYSESTTFLRDLQLMPEFQGKGIGTKCLALIIDHALNQTSAKLMLRVFSENPAIELYERKGFTKISDVKGVVEMELPLDSNALRHVIHQYV